MSPDDSRWMRRAISEAWKARGRTAPNPPVGCVIVKHGKCIATGHTQPGGRPHAETTALANAHGNVEGATAYVTLEPCSHYGKTPSCANALLKAGIARCVIAESDPDPRVNGRGVKLLLAGGVRVEIGLLDKKARECHGGFISRTVAGRPRVTLKLATSQDGQIACKNGASQWITGPEARQHVHKMRHWSDAMLIGVGTVLKDNPRLTCRLGKSLRHATQQPLRVILDSTLRTPATSRLFEDVHVAPILFICRSDADMRLQEQLQKQGAEIITVAPKHENNCGLAHHNLAKSALKALAVRGCNDVLCEGGGQLAANLLHFNLVDDIAWFRAPMLIGGDGIPAFGSLGVTHPDLASRLTLISNRKFGSDRLEVWRKIV